MARKTGINVEKDSNGEILSVTFNWKKYKHTLEEAFKEKGICFETEKEKKLKEEFYTDFSEALPREVFMNRFLSKIEDCFDVDGNNKFLKNTK